MGLSTSKTTQTSSGSENQNATTTPQNPSWVTDSLMDYTGRIGSMLDSDPNSFVASASPLQQQAWSNADRLGQWTGNANAASNIALNAANAPASTVPGAAGYTAAKGGASTYSPATLANPREATATGYNAAQSAGTGYSSPAFSPLQLGPGGYAGDTGGVRPVPVTGRMDLGQSSLGSAPGSIPFALTSSTGYDAAKAAAQGYAAPNLDQAASASGKGYDAAQAGPVNVGPVSNAAVSNASAASLLDNLNSYMNPYRDQVVSAAMADFDRQAGQQRAALEAQGAKAGAFGGSRFGIAQANLEDNLARARASTEAGLLSNAFDTAAGLSQSDAANRQQANLFNAQNQTGVSQANAAAANQRALSQAGIDAQLGLANMDARNQAGQFGAAAQNAASLANQTAQNQFALSRAQMQENAAQFRAQAQNQAALANAAAQDQASQFGAAASNAAGLANQGAFNQRKPGSRYGGRTGPRLLRDLCIRFVM